MYARVTVEFLDERGKQERPKVSADVALHEDVAVVAREEPRGVLFWIFGEAEKKLARAAEPAPRPPREEPAEAKGLEANPESNE